MTMAWIHSTFRHLAHQTATWVGSSSAFGLALLSIVLWACLGPYFQYADTWQLVINTSTTIITFMMVFLIQNTQNRDSKALHLKLDELIRAHHSARNSLIELEVLPDDVLDKLEREFHALRQKDDDLHNALATIHQEIKHTRKDPSPLKA